jgi:hypothetical protein
VQGPSRASTRPQVPAQCRPTPSLKRARSPLANAAANASGDLHGPLVLAAVVGDAHGKWRKEFAYKVWGVAAREQLQCLRRGIAGVAADSGCVGDTVGPLSLHGFMVIRSWSWLGDHHHDSLQTHAMKEALGHKHQRSSNIQHLEHKVVCAAALDRPLSLDDKKDAPLLEQCLKLTVASKFLVAARPGTRAGPPDIVNGFQALKTRWQPHLAKDKPVCIWKLWTLLAQHIVHGDWTIDVTAVTPRAHADHWRPPFFSAAEDLDCNATQGLQLGCEGRAATGGGSQGPGGRRAT